MVLIMNNKEIMEMDDKYIIHTYGRQPIALAKGNGCHVTDVEGKEYLDCFAGIAVNALGHAHPKIVETIANQAKRLMHVSNIYYTQEQVELAKLLIDLTSHDKLFYCNSGAEANEGAIKLARKFTSKHEIISANNSFHGRTITTLAATGQKKYQDPFRPLTPGFCQVDYNNIEALSEKINEKTAAVLLEPIQGEGGVIVPDKNYLKEVKKLAIENDALLILDEVQTGFGRTGKLFASELYNVEADITCTAKGIASGFPFAAFLANQEVATAFKPGDHGTTFGGNPLGCAVAKTSIETIINDNLIENAETLGAYIKKEIPDYDSIVEIRGEGLLIGIQMDKDAGELVDKAREKGVLINCTAGNVIRLAPPLIFNKEEANQLLGVLDEIFKSF